ncbi:synaptic vesicle glycoprotein 2B-like [Topomyia yanbarensis]|uniref:synaptic vesicle glycoprotein 2B-like n=1 Tax=Topomyia yanbarensis TaxID=2498891 RepID=UPI00273CDF84|nr:synaptic vesicle glycoprotein 2B-like [Topomyia yanbarensis]
MSQISSPTNVNGVVPPEKRFPVQFEDALDQVGFGRVQLETTLLCCLIVMATICETMGISVILPAAKCDLGLETGNQGILSGSTFLGIVAASYFSGYLSDTQGRKKVMQYALYAAAVCAVASSFTNDFVSLLILRLMAGVCSSAPSATIYAYLGEFCSPSKRAQVIVFTSVWAMGTMIYIALVGWWILSYDWSWAIAPDYHYQPWRLLFIVYTIPGLLAAFLFRFFPESPKFYMAQGRIDRALEVLKHCYQKNKGSLKGFPISVLIPEKELSAGKLGIFRSLWQQTAPLFKWPLLLYFTVCCLQQISAFAVYGGLGLWYPELMNQVTSTEGDLTICSVVQSTRTVNASKDVFNEEECMAQINTETFIYILVMGAYGAGCSLVVTLLLGKINQRVMLVINFLIAAAAGIILQFVTNRYAIVVLFCTEVVLGGLSMVLVNTSSVSIFPTHVRAMAVSLSMMMARLSSFTFSSVVGFVMVDSCVATLYVFSAILIFGASLTVFLPR